MKIFRIDRQAGEWPRAAATLLATPEAVCGGALPARLVADSAVVRNNRPVFVPDFAREGWVVEVLPAIHIERLGKFISPRFALRHVGRFSLVGCLRPAGKSVPDALTDSFDGAIVVGQTGSFPQGDTLSVTARFEPLPVVRPGAPTGATREERVEVEMASLHVADTIALLSRYATLKSGDMIIPASIGVSFPVSLDRSLAACADGAYPLVLRLK